jgi:hypothetical protein
MQKRVKKMMLGMLMMSMLVSGMITSHSSPAAAESQPEKQSVVVSTCSSVSSPLSEVQYKKFMSYLTQEYAPEMKTEWEKALEERHNVQPVIMAGTVTLSESINKIDGKTTEDIKILLDKAGIPEGAKVEAYKANIFNTEPKEITLTVLKTDTGSDKNADQEKDNMVSIRFKGPVEDENFITQLKLQIELDQAITSNDSKAINTVLGKMLTNYKQITEDMKSNLSNVENTDN